MPEYRIVVDGVNIGRQFVIDSQDPDGDPWWTDDRNAALEEIERLQQAHPLQTFRLHPDPARAFSPVPGAAQMQMAGAEIAYRVRWRTARPTESYAVRQFDDYGELSRQISWVRTSARHPGSLQVWYRGHYKAGQVGPDGKGCLVGGYTDWIEIG